MRATACAAVCFACLVGALPADPQTVHGQLLDADSRQPILTGEVALLWGESGDRAVFTATTDTAGSFLLRAKQPGWYRLRARRIGYEEVISPPIELGPGGSMEVELVMSASAVPLAPLTVLARAAPAGNLRLVTSGFYERRKRWGKEGLGMGHFLDGADLDKQNYSRVSQVLQEVPGVLVEGCGGRSACIHMRAVTRIQTRQGRAAVAAPCTPSIYLDGQLLNLQTPRGNRLEFSDVSIDQMLNARSLAAVEVYPSVNHPPEFGNMVDEPCGAIALWTGGRDQPRDTIGDRKR